jgi:hypothetical protein
MSFRQLRWACGALGLIAGLAWLIPSGNANHLPREADRILNNAVRSMLYSLDPGNMTQARSPVFGYCTVLGRTELNQAQTTEAAKALNEAIAGSNGAAAACFNPRHALEIEADGHTYDYVVCYECQQLDVFKDGVQVASVLVKGPPQVLNDLLRANNIPLAKQDE